MKDRAKRLSALIERASFSIGGELRLMEVCGTHTVEIFRAGIRGLLPSNIRLLSGPGCPVCVTSEEDIERAILLARLPDIVLCTFGDMMRVPGYDSSLLVERAKGADIRIVISPLECLKIATKMPDKRVVFFATGFETTSPTTSATLIEAKRQGIGNFFIYSVHKLVPPALRALLVGHRNNIDGLILPGHVSAIIGTKPYGFISEEFSVPSVVTGFGSIDILQAIYMLLRQIEDNAPRVENQYISIVREEGNPRALGLIREVFEPCDAEWRGIGEIPLSGLRLNERYQGFDIKNHIEIGIEKRKRHTGCRCGDVMKALIVPTECPLFGDACTPAHPIGACMVSTEGSCAAYYRYGR